VNPEVAEWLHSPEGEEWSRRRIRGARAGSRSIMIDAQCGTHTYLGFFSLKGDNIDPFMPEMIQTEYTGDLWWGDLPGDEKVEVK